MDPLEQSDAEESRSQRRNLMLMGLAIVALLAIAAYGLREMLGGHNAAAKKPPKISLLPATPPPPPPPPPKEEKRPEPPKVEKEVKMAPEEKKDQPPPDQSLKMEGAAGDGPSMFGAGKVTSEDLSKIGAAGTGTGTGGLTNPFNTYAMTIKGELQRMLARKAELKKRQYKVEVLVWVSEEGLLKRFELVGSTRDDDTDEAIREALAALPSFSEAPPPKMPLPIKLRIVASGRA